MNGGNLGLSVHVCRRCDDAIELRNYQSRIRTHASIDGGAVCRHPSHQLTTIGQLGKSAWFNAERVVLHLKRRQHVTVGESHEAVGMHHPRDIAELVGDFRMRGVLDVEDESLPGRKPIREQPPIGWHLILGVMRPVAVPRYWEGCEQPPVTAGGRTHIEDRQKIRLRAVGGAGPCVEVIARRVALRMQGCRADTRQEQIDQTGRAFFHHRVFKDNFNCCQWRGSSLRRSRSMFKRRNPLRDS